MGAYHDSVQRTEVLAVAVICALLNGTFDTLVSLAAHLTSSFILRFGVSMAENEENIMDF